jgi:Transposase DDE domain
LRHRLGWRLEVPHHPDRQLWRYGLEEKPRGFGVLPRRWVVERTFAWLGLSRRFSKDYERLPETAETMIYGAMSRLMLRAGWRGRHEAILTRLRVCQTPSRRGLLENWVSSIPLLPETGLPAYGVLGSSTKPPKLGHLTLVSSPLLGVRFNRYVARERLVKAQDSNLVSS